MNLADVLIDKILEMNRENFKNLKANLDYNEKNASWVFCLGAGVSMSCGLPGWAKLLAMISGKVLGSYSESYKAKNHWLEIMVETIQNTMKNDEFEKKVKGAANGDTAKMYSGIDLLELAEYIRAMIKDQLRIDDENLIDGVLCDYIRQCYDIQYDSDDNIKIKKYDESTLRAVVETMKKRKIRRAITYNYDDLLEIALQRDGNKVESIVPDEQKEFIRFIRFIIATVLSLLRIQGKRNLLKSY